VAEVVLTRRARKDLEALDPPVRGRILDRLVELEDEPLRNAIRLTDARLGTYRARVGDWRVIFDLDGEVVVVLRIGHRRHEKTKTAAVTKALKEFVARREQKRILELFGALEWSRGYDYKAERGRD